MIKFNLIQQNNIVWYFIINFTRPRVDVMSGNTIEKKSQPYTEVGCRRAAEALRSMKPGRSSRGEANSLHPPPKKERSWGSGFKGFRV